MEEVVVDTSTQRPKKQPPPPAQITEEEPRCARLAVRSSAPGDRADNMATPVG